MEKPCIAFSSHVSLFLNNFFLKRNIFFNWFCTNIYPKLLIFQFSNQILEMLKKECNECFFLADTLTSSLRGIEESSTSVPKTSWYLSIFRSFTSGITTDNFRNTPLRYAAYLQSSLNPVTMRQGTVTEDGVARFQLQLPAKYLNRSSVFFSSQNVIC